MNDNFYCKNWENVGHTCEDGQCDACAHMDAPDPVTAIYRKYCPNVYVAATEADNLTKGDVITMQTRHGNEHEAMVWNYLGADRRDGLHVYSVTRTDGFNVQEWAKRKAERLLEWAGNAGGRADEAYKRSMKDKDFLVLAEPIKIGHHSEKRHRKALANAWAQMGKYVEESARADNLVARAAYWERKTETINLSMPDSIEYYATMLEEAKARHAAYKDGSRPREHSYSLTYAKKRVNEMQKNLALAERLWGEQTNS